jgi:uncharacterized membrane protein
MKVLECVGLISIVSLVYFLIVFLVYFVVGYLAKRRGYKEDLNTGELVYVGKRK